MKASLVPLQLCTVLWCPEQHNNHRYIHVRVFSVFFFIPAPPLEYTLRSSFQQDFEETKGSTPGVFFSGSEKMC